MRIRKQNRRRIRPTSRKGMATLEFIIGFPFLLFIFAAVYAVSWVGVNRAKVIHESRHQVWKMRDSESEHEIEELNRNSNTKPLSIPIPTKTLEKILGGDDDLDDNVDRNNTVDTGNMQGEIWGENEHTVGTYRWMGGAREFTVGSGLIFGTWDDDELQFNGPQPHVFEAVYKMTGLGSDGLGQSGLSGGGGGGIMDLFSPPSD